MLSLRRQFSSSLLSSSKAIKPLLFSSTTSTTVSLINTKRFSTIDYSAATPSSSSSSSAPSGSGGAQTIHKDHHMESVLFSPSVPQTGRRIEKAPTSGVEWRELAHSMTHPHQTVVVDGVHYNQVECILRALQFDPKDAVCWYELGTAILGGAKVGSYTAVGSFHKSVNLDKSNPAAWTALGSVMATFDVITINDLPINKQTCFERALELDPKNTLAWMCLADYLASRPPKKLATGIVDPDALQEESTSTVNGKTYNAIDCYAIVLEFEPERFPAWNNCGLALVGKPSYDMEGKPKASKIECKKTVNVKGIPYNCLGCFVKAIELDPSYSFVWRNLAVCIPKEVESEFKVNIDDKDYLRQELLDEANKIDQGTSKFSYNHEEHLHLQNNHQPLQNPNNHQQQQGGVMGMPEMGGEEESI